MEEPADYRQAQEQDEMLQWLEEQDAKRRERALEIWTEMNKEKSDEHCPQETE